MGNFNSTRLKSDFKNDNKIDGSLKKVDRILTNLMTRYDSEFLNQEFCQKVRLFIKDDLANNLLKSEIEGLGKKVFIGIPQPGKHDEICQKLSRYYLKKINLISSIHYIMEYIHYKFSHLVNGPLCFLDNRLKYSTIPIAGNYSELLKSNKKKKFTLQIDRQEIREMALEKLMKNKETKDYFSNYDNKSNYKKRLLIKEITNKEKCLSQNGEFIDKSELISQKIIPDSQITKYNKGYQSRIKKTEDKIDSLCRNLVSQLLKLVTIDTKDKDTPVYTDKILTNEQLNKVIKQCKIIIKQLLVEIDIIYLSTATANIIDKTDLKNEENLLDSLKKENLRQKKLKAKLSMSN